MANINGNNSANALNGSALADFINAKGGHDTIMAGDGNDTVWGGSGNDLVNGGAGNDALLGDDGADTIGGGTGDDVVNGGAGNDALLGDDGADTIGGGTGDDVVNGGAGIDTALFATSVTVNLASGIATGEGTDTLVSIENVSGSNFADWITGSAGSNRLAGNGGADTLFVSGGIDTLDGGAGNDAVDFSTGGAATASLASGTYAVAGGSGTMIGIEHLAGSSAGDSLTGNSAANKLDGKDGADTLAGGAGDDQLWGGAGSDRLVADGGNDYLVGNYAMFDGFADTAPDTFVIAASAGTITVSDFEPGVDKLDLTHFGFDQNGTSATWTGSAAQVGFDTVLTLTGQNSQSVTIVLQGVTEGHRLSTADMIGGSASLIAPPPLYPINGGNGLADVFVIDPQHGNVTIEHFENGLDRLDVSGVVNAGWDGTLSNLPDGSAVLEFFDGNGGAFSVTLAGHHYALVDPSDYIL